MFEKDDVGEKVNQFYNLMPFNYGSVESRAAEIKRCDQVKNYGQLSGLISHAGTNEEILDVGCGVGWFSNSVAYYYKSKVLGIDMCQNALDRAANISWALGVSDFIDFKIGDLFELPYDNRFFLVNSLGVLHHTYSARQALKKISRYVKPGGFLHVGLYHRYGRKPFLDLFKKIRKKIEAGKPYKQKLEVAMFKIYKELNPTGEDEEFLMSWFRDQVLHPFETQHTLEEVCNWLEEINFKLIETSINRFDCPFEFSELFELEKAYHDLSIEKNHKQKKYFPGFFTILAKKKDSSLAEGCK